MTHQLLKTKNGVRRVPGAGRLRVSRAAQPSEALVALDGFLSGLPAGVQLFSLFEANPQLIDLLIDIVGTESPWPDREKYPESFQIDELRCIFCGMCEEACPVDAIELTSLFDLTGRSREEMIFNKEKLLSVYDQTKDAEPMKSAQLGGTL